MRGLGTIINVLAIISGGILGLCFGKMIRPRWQEALIKSTGLCSLFLGLSGALSGMFTISGGKLESGHSLMMILSLVAGTLLGEAADLEQRMEEFGVWLRNRTGNAGDSRFIDGFLTATLTVCIGAMAIVGAIQDGIYGDYSILAAKSVMDFVIVMIMASSMGKGCVFSAVPVGIWQGVITLLAGVVAPMLTDAALANLSLVGSILIFCVGLNLIFPKTTRVANMLPALLIAAGFAYIPGF